MVTSPKHQMKSVSLTSTFCPTSIFSIFFLSYHVLRSHFWFSHWILTSASSQFEMSYEITSSMVKHGRRTVPLAVLMVFSQTKHCFLMMRYSSMHWVQKLWPQTVVWHLWMKLKQSGQIKLLKSWLGSISWSNSKSSKFLGIGVSQSRLLADYTSLISFLKS